MTGRRLLRGLARLARAGLVAGLVVWLVLLRPTALAGSTTYVFVGGESMLPTFAIGDLIVAQPAPAYGPGMIVVYQIPAGEPGAGRLVIHRIVGGDADAGFVTRGDHNSYTDTWHPRAADIVGTPAAVLPGLGKVIGILRQPLVAATLAALLVMSTFWPRREAGSDPGPALPSRLGEASSAGA